jgi:hypothetical protein
VHCAGGRHRTGAMGAVTVFSFMIGIYDQVYKEMKQYDFYTRFGHKAFKEFVADYARTHVNKKVSADRTQTKQ